METIFEEQKEQETTYTELRFQDTSYGKLILKIMIYTLVSIVWFAVTVFIPPLFIVTIILLVVYSDYCGNHYETETIFEEQKEQETTYTELRFQETETGKLILKIMIYTLVSIIWFAVTVLIPPLFIITIILLVIYSAYCLIIKKK